MHLLDYSNFEDLLQSTAILSIVGLAVFLLLIRWVLAIEKMKKYNQIQIKLLEEIALKLGVEESKVDEATKGYTE